MGSGTRILEHPAQSSSFHNVQFEGGQRLDYSSPDGPQTRRTEAVLLNGVDDPLKKEHAQISRSVKRTSKLILRAQSCAHAADARLRRALEGSLSETSTEQMAQRLRDWSAIDAALREAILDTKDLAVRSAGFISVFLSVCLPPTGRAGVGVLQSFKDGNTLRELHAMTEMVSGKYSRIAERMARFKDNFANERSRQARGILLMVDNAERILTRIIQPLPSPSVEQTVLLDNSSIPGLMIWIIAFLPKKSMRRIDEFIEGQRANFSLEGGEGGRSPDMQSYNLIKCLLDVGHMITADLAIALNSPSRHLDDKKWDYAVQSTYAYIEFALKEFDESLTAAVTNVEASPGKTCLRACDLPFHFRKFLQIMQIPLRADL